MNRRNVTDRAIIEGFRRGLENQTPKRLLIPRKVKEKVEAGKENNINPEKIFILDTNVYILGPDCVFEFDNNIIILPSVVTQELDSLKIKDGFLGYCAREAIRNINEIMANCTEEIPGCLVGKIREDLGKILFTGINENDYERFCKQFGLEIEKKDNKIIFTAYLFAKLNKDKKVIFVSRDTNARITAKIVGVEAQDYIHDKSDTFQTQGRLLNKKRSLRKEEEILSVRYQRIDDSSFYKIRGTERQRVEAYKEVCNLSVRNIEQKALLTALLDSKISVLAVSGQAGTGKTLLAFLAGIYQTLDPQVVKRTGRSLYEKIVVTRAAINVGGEDFGFLPGEIGSKMSPYMKPIEITRELIEKRIVEKIKEGDSKEIISQDAEQVKVKRKRRNQGGLSQKIHSEIDKILKIEPIAFMRGVTFSNSFIIIDEAQNISPPMMKTILTRVGEGSKIVVLFDPDQIDNRYLDKFSNGAASLVNAFSGTEEFFCYLQLTKTERSLVAARAAVLL